jgi:hypothetical protein
MALPDLARFASLAFLSNGRPIRVPDVDIFGAAGLNPISPNYALKYTRSKLELYS